MSHGHRVPSIKAWQEGPVGKLVISNPGRRNACTTDMWKAIAEGMHAFGSNPDIRVVTIEGEGADFMSGADVGEFSDRLDQPETIRTVERAAVSAFQATWDCEKPTVAIIRGYCLGGGLALATSCDLRVASDDTIYGIPAVKLGVGYSVESFLRIRMLVGPAFAKEILFTGRHFDAPTAQRTGLINATCPVDQLQTEADRLIGMIEAAAPLTIRALKEIDRDVERSHTASELEKWDAWADRCFASSDFVEGCRAFAEKRRPRFEGR